MRLLLRFRLSGPPLIALLLGAAVARAEVVHVFQQTAAGGVTNLLSDSTLDTGGDYLTTSAPSIAGHIFTHWSINANQPFDNRDTWGRAHDAAPFHLYEALTLTANYLPVSQDTDGDGVADGHEIYWYGSLVESALSDTDGDGLTFAEEIVRGSNPLFPDTYLAGAVVPALCAPLLYNPHSYAPYVLRSEPEGVLFATSTNYAERGETVATTGYDPGTSVFAYWTIDGVRQNDAWGCALASASFTGSVDRAIDVVAHTAANDLERHALHYYGNASVAADSDTDGDGLTFAEEIARGSNPLFPDAYLPGAVSPAVCARLLYNPHSYAPYVLRCDPADALFASVTNYALPGAVITTDAYDPDASAFAYWTVDGVCQTDLWGRALEAASFTGTTARIVQVVAHTADDDIVRHALHYYGDASIAAQSDTDGDGLTFAEEIARGSNPLFPDAYLAGAVVAAANRPLEMNLQPFEQVRGAIVGDAYTELFTSPIAGNEATSATFGNGAAIWPVVADLNGDGLFDIVVLSATTTNVLLNVGGEGNPEFEARDGGDAIATSGVDLATNSTAKLAALELDVAAPADALSATFGDANQDGLSDLLVSDSAGRIWYYRSFAGAGSASPHFTLQHKVWGGSYAGFAEGLRLAAVDWDDDGDLDCLAGTAAGKLMLLRDPKVGRPTNLKAEAGIDSVVLSWDPNLQSRIRGYRVYRKSVDGEPETQNEEDFGRIAEPPLPTYRDTPPETASYDYRVSSVSRFYTAGNSTPTVTESPATETVRATVGGVKFAWRDASARVGDRVEVVLSIENALNFDVAGRSQSLAYDPEYLRPVEVLKSGLPEGCGLTAAVAEDGDPPAGSWNISMTGGVLPAGSGRFLTFVFEALKEGETTVGGENGAAISIAARAGNAPYRLGDVNGDGFVNKEDLSLLAHLKNGNGHKPTAYQLKAGDFNGNGKLDNADFQALKKLLKETESM